MTKEISNSEDLIDVRDIIARVEELETNETEADIEALRQTDEADELVALRELLGELAGNGGDEQWRDDWYPITMIRDSYFKTYAQDLAEDTGAIPDDAQWPCTCIDWDKAARELLMDYTSVELDGVTYWVR